MKLFGRFALALSIGALVLTSACSGGGNPEWAATLDSVGGQLDLIRQAQAQESAPQSPEAEATYQNMQALWERMNRARSGMMNGRGMMMGRGMMGGPAMMHFYELNQQMLSYSMGMRQMMRQSGHMDMASMYGQMAEGMRMALSQLPEKSGEPPAPQPGEAPVDGAASFAANCAACHGPDGAGVGGVFPPLTRSSIVTGDQEALARIVLHGLQGPLTVGGTRYDGLMPGFESTLSDAQIAATLTHVRSLPGNAAGAVTADYVHDLRQEAVSHSQVWTTEELGLN